MDHWPHNVKHDFIDKTETCRKTSLNTLDEERSHIVHADNQYRKEEYSKPMTEWSVLDSDETVQTCSEAKQRTRQRARRNVLSLSPSDVSATTASKITMATNTNDVIRKRQRIVDGVRVVQLMLHRLWRKMACAVLFCALRLFAEAQRVQAGHLPLLAASVE